MQQKQTRIPPVIIGAKDYEDFKILAKRNNLTVSKAIRNIITVYLDRKEIPTDAGRDKGGKEVAKKDLPFSALMFHSKNKGGLDSTNYKEHLYGKHSKYAHN